MSVLLPQPLRPTIPKNSPRRTSKDTSCSACSRSKLRRRSGCTIRSLSVWICSRGRRNCLETPSTLTATSSGGAGTRRQRSERTSAPRDPRRREPRRVPRRAARRGRGRAPGARRAGGGRRARRAAAGVEPRRAARRPAPAPGAASGHARLREPRRHARRARRARLRAVRRPPRHRAVVVGGRRRSRRAGLRAFDGIDEVWAGSRFVADAIAAVSPGAGRARAAAGAPSRPSRRWTAATLGLPADGLARRPRVRLRRASRRGRTRSARSTRSRGPSARRRRGARREDRRAPTSTPPSTRAVLDAAARAPARAGARPRPAGGGEERAHRHARLLLSVHRSEGFGLTLAEATLLGVPVVATDYGGTRDFLTPFNALARRPPARADRPGQRPVPRRRRVGGAGPRPRRRAAARGAVEAPQEASRRATRAREDVLRDHDPLAAGRAMAARLQRIVRAPVDAAAGPVDALHLGAARARVRGGPGPGARHGRARRGARGGAARACGPTPCTSGSSTRSSCARWRRSTSGSAASPPARRRSPPSLHGCAARARARSLPSPMSSPVPSLAASLGVDVAGYLKGGLGLGQAARLYVSALQAAGVPVRTTTIDLRMPEVHGDDGTRAEVKTTDFADLDFEGDLPFNLVCVNAPELPQFVCRGRARQVPRPLHDRRVGLGDRRDPARAGTRRSALVDEIWVYSRYVADLLGHAAPCPVVRVPLPIEVPQPSGDDVGFALGATRSRSSSSSTSGRRCSARTRSGSCRRSRGRSSRARDRGSLLKSFNGDYKPDRLAQLRAATGGRDDIVVVDKFVTDQQRVNPHRALRRYVSLHRSEGFGLTLGEAMALGKPVVGTGYGGNADFMTPQNSWLVDYEETLVGPEGENYPAHGTWAEPDVDHAAALLRQVWENRDEARARAERGRLDVAEHFSLQAVGELARARLRRLSGLNRRRSVGLAASAPGGAGTPALLRGDRRGEGDVRRERRRRSDGRREGRGAQGAAHGDAAVHVPPGRAEHVRRERAAGARRRCSATTSWTRRRSCAAWRAGGARGADGERLRPDRRWARRAARTSRGCSRARGRGRRRRIPRSPTSTTRAAARWASATRTSTARGYRGFEDIFRGDEQDVRQAQERYVELMRDRSWVLDLGCGRGELLDALRDAGLARGGRGPRRDDGRAGPREGPRGLAGGRRDRPAVLRRRDRAGACSRRRSWSTCRRTSSPSCSRCASPSSSRAAWRSSRPSTRTTPAALKAFWTDTTHHHPVFPEVLLAHCRLAGFSHGDVVFPQESGDFDRDVYANRDYAVVARVGCLRVAAWFVAVAPLGAFVRGLGRARLHRLGGRERGRGATRCR